MLSRYSTRGGRSAPRCTPHSDYRDRRGVTVPIVGFWRTAPGQSRIADRAGEGEVLTSDLTRQLMIGSKASFVERGEAELKGVPGVWSLYAATFN